MFFSVSYKSTIYYQMLTAQFDDINWKISISSTHLASNYEEIFFMELVVLLIMRSYIMPETDKQTTERSNQRTLSMIK